MTLKALVGKETRKFYDGSEKFVCYIVSNAHPDVTADDFRQIPGVSLISVSSFHIGEFTFRIFVPESAEMEEQLRIIADRENLPRIPTPEEFADRMREIFRESEVTQRHMDADEAMLSLLESLGYQEAVSIFADMTKWYD